VGAAALAVEVETAAVAARAMGHKAEGLAAEDA